MTGAGRYGRVAVCVEEPGRPGALAEGAHVARAAGGRLLAVHAAAEPEAVRPEDLAAGARAGAPPPEPVVIADGGHPGAAVCGWAAQEGIGLLVAEPHKGAVARLLLGSFASHLVDHAPCDVMIARPAPSAGGEPAQTAGPLGRVACCVDGSAGARTALAVAAGLREAGGGSLTAVHAVHPVAGGPGAAAGRRLLGELAAPVGARTAVVHGDPAAAIALWAAGERVSLLVTSSRGAGGRGPALGSVARRIVRRASCSVLVVRP